MGFRVLVTSLPMISTFEHCKERFIAEGLEVVIPEMTGQYLTEDELCEMIADFDGIIAGDDLYTAKVLEKGREGRLRALVRLGIGFDAVDVEATRRFGIAFSNTPGVFSDEVADLALGYLLLLARGIHRVDAEIRRGNWLKLQGTTLRGKVAGIIGVGNIGKEIVRRVKGFGMSVCAYHTHPLSSDFCKETGAQQVELEQVLRTADYLFLACSLKLQNHHMLNEQTFALMKDGVSIVNIARGGLIDECALINALDTGKVAGAALDVFESEPLDLKHPLCSYEQVVLGAHNGSNTKEGVLRANQAAIDLLVKFLRENV